VDLPFSRFVSALKSALRDFRRPDLLAQNPLMRSHLMAARGPRPADLQTLLTETTAALFVSPRDQKLRRVLELTYFDAELKQEAAAERLGLPFGTYRRHLTTAISRLARWLWEHEQAGPSAPAVEASTVSRAPPGQICDRPRLSLVVLPFINFGGGPDQDYFVDGITESLTTDISSIPGIFVIARNTAFSYRGTSVDARQIGRELGVRYVMEGSVQSSASRFRVNAQLIDAETGAHIWAERFDKARADLFDVQDEVTARLARMVDVELVAAESRRAERERPNNMDSIDLAMRGWAIFHRQLSPEGLRESRAMFEAALRLDDGNVSALIGFAESHVTEVNAYASDSRDQQVRIAERTIEKALKLAPDNAHAHFCRAEVWSALRSPEQALRELEVAIALDRNYANAHAFAGITKVFLGRAEETEAHVAEAMRLSPRDPMLAIWHLFKGGANLHLSRIGRAVDELQRSVEINPNDALARFYLAAALALAGRTQEAADAVAIGSARMPKFTINRFRTQARSDNASYLKQRELIMAGMRAAGVPE
jgi:TolB-like protein/Flp pilus assembly protein TadD